jgi:hypothetical protein
MPKPGECEVAAALLGVAWIQPRMVIVADKGFANAEFDQLVGDLGVGLVRAERAEEAPQFGALV